ncbi:YncE family protein [Pedobacter alpinus]|uniref:YncE family protein n=1 Tax=Pedobacter alpinus TaxID=1590643 RepID=A0ABW5TQP2_9SPHI
MKKNTTNYIKKALGATLLSALIFTACKKNDTDPIANPVSRLFVSNADLTNPNLSVYSPADGATLPSPMQVNTSAPDGNGVVYDAASNVGFQVSRQDKTIKKFTVSSTGEVTVTGSFVDATLTSGRDAAYDAANKTLYVASNTDSKIFVYANAPALTGSVTANKVFTLDGQPWGLDFANGSLMVLIDLDRKEIQLFKNVNSIATGTVTPSNKITIPAATRLHGLVYDAASDLLLVTEIGAATASPLAIPAFNADGGIYIIEGAMAKFTANAAVTANRTIFGSNTMMGNPVDITFDARAGKKLIYVAEKANKKILVFKLTDNGNVAPTTSATVTTLPESIFLDAR